ncbi:hypothetical protein ACHAQA_001145 [Verticillium albo-atrum]
MDSRFSAPRDELYTLQMDLKQVQLVQNSQAERLARLERRQEQDANLKSVWQQHPFPGVLAGTPQQGPTHVSSHDLYDMDEPDNLLNSLHLGPAEEEPARRGAASRANSVRFDESALRQSDWASHSARHSGEFGPPRPGSGMLMERSLSHKSDGRHSSAGHSVHSVHSLASGRASSLGLHTDNFMVSSHEDDSPIDAPGPPPEFFVLGSVPSIIRCWLSTNFDHGSIRYADLCTGSQKSVIDYSLVRDLELEDDIERDVDGAYKIRMDVYLVEATAERTRRASSPGQIPSITATFEVTGMDQAEATEGKKGIQVFIGSDTLRAHMADILLSQNRMSLIGNGREKLSVPFVRPEDDACFKYIYTANVIPERPRLNANARPFVSFEPHAQVAPSQDYADDAESCGRVEDDISRGLPSPMMDDLETSKSLGTSVGALSESGGDGESQAKELSGSVSVTGSTEGGRRGSSGGIWGSWRHGTAASGTENGQRDSGPLSGYQPAGRGGRSMKVLKPLKSGTSSSSARTGAAYEPAPGRRTSGEQRRKSQINSGASDSGSSNGLRWEAKRAVSTSAVSQVSQASQASQPRETRETRSTTVTSTASGPSHTTPLATPMPRSANPIGGASAFSWMNPAGKAKQTATAE